MFSPRKFAAALILVFALMFVIGRHIATNAPSATATCDQTNTPTSTTDDFGVPVEVDGQVGGTIGGGESPKAATGNPKIKSVQQAMRPECNTLYADQQDNN